MQPSAVDDAIDFALPERIAATRAFDRASRHFDRASVVHDHARAALLARFEYLSIDPTMIVDVGCGLGQGGAALGIRYPDAAVLGIDTSVEMCGAAMRNGLQSVVCADAQILPVPNHSAGVLFANLVPAWCRPERLFADAARALVDNGVFVFSTLGPDTLAEVRAAWASADDSIHVHAGFDMHDLGDLAARSGLAEPVMDVERLTLTYRDIVSLVADLRAVGAVNTAGGRRKSLTGKARWRRFENALMQGRRDDRFSVTIELIYGQAWGRGPTHRVAAPGSGETSISISEIGRR